MAYLEITKAGKLLSRQRVDDPRAKAGLKVRLAGDQSVSVKLGETQHVGEYQVRIVQDTIGAALADQAPAPGDSTATDGQAPSLDGYDLRERIGEGGMGVVWKGIQRSTGRMVAVKFLGRRAFGSDRSRKRFEREVHLSAKLVHPAIVRLYDSGLWHGAYFYTMELIEGKAIDDFAAENKLKRDDILRLFAALCQAVQYAHDCGVVHRDLKPSNVLVSKDGQPHVLDFGLAKSLLEDTEADDIPLALSMEGEAAGTPAYMSPEQASGRHAETDGRTDVWSIGVMLYRMLVGQPPHELSGTRYDVSRRIVEEEIRSPRTLGASLGADLEGILRKALATRPDDRYLTVGDFAQDIEHFLAGKPLIARKATIVYRLQKTLARRKLVTVACTVLSIAIVVIGIGLGPNGWLRQRLTAGMTNTRTMIITAPEVNEFTLLQPTFKQRYAAVQDCDPTDGIGEMITDARVLDATAIAFADQRKMTLAMSHRRAAIQLCSDIATEVAFRKQPATSEAPSTGGTAAVGVSEGERQLAIAALKPLEAFCGSYNMVVKQEGSRDQQGTMIARMRLGGTACTIETVQPMSDDRPAYWENIVLYYVPKTATICGIKWVHAMGWRELTVSINPTTLSMRYGGRIDEMSLHLDGSVALSLHDAKNTNNVLVSSTGSRIDRNGTAAMSIPAGAPIRFMSPFLVDYFPIDPLANSTIVAPGFEPIPRSAASMYIMRLDMDVRCHDWAEADILMNLLATQCATSPALVTERHLLSAWRRIVADGEMADGMSTAPPTDTSPQSTTAPLVAAITSLPPKAQPDPAQPTTSLSTASPVFHAPQGDTHAVDLLPLFDPASGAFRGKWTQSSAGLLVNSQHNQYGIRAPYRPPAEYDYRVHFTVNGSRDQKPIVSLMMPFGPDVVDVTLTGTASSHRPAISAHQFSEDFTHCTAFNGIEIAKSYDAICQVRTDGVSVYLNGKLSLQCHLPAGGRCGKTHPWLYIGDNVMGLNVAAAEVVFDTVQLVEINGQGSRVVPFPDYGLRILSEALPPDNVLRTVNLMELISVPANVVGGTWSMNGDTLSATAGNTQLQIDYVPPEEYDLRVVFSRKGVNPVCMVLSQDGHPFEFDAAAEYDTYCGFVLPGDDATASPAFCRRLPPLLSAKEKHTAIVFVRTNGVWATIDDKVVAHCPATDFSKLGTGAIWSPPDALVGLRSAFNGADFYSIDIAEITGTGHPGKGTVKRNTAATTGPARATDPPTNDVSP